MFQKVPLFFLFWFILLTFQEREGTSALENGAARTPPMGWMAWERFTCETNCAEHPDNCINSRLFKSMADRLVHDGYTSLGYEYVNIDDCWSMKHRDRKTQRLVPDLERFPEGIKDLSEHLHNQGLKLGIYGDCGTQTCAGVGYPAQLKTNESLNDNYFDTDAKTLSNWEVDSFKFDGCFIDPMAAESICPQMGNYLLVNQKPNNPIILTCEWPFYMLRHNRSIEPNYTLAAESCNTWRYYEDVEDSWSSILDIIDFTVNMQSTILEYHGPGHWFDPDQLVIGNFGLSHDEARAQMAIWSIWSAPLYMSNDLREIDPAMAVILKNKNLIAVNQDRLGVFGMMVERPESKIEVFVKPVEAIRNGCPSFVIAYLNRNSLGNRRKVSVNLRKLLLKLSSSIQLASKRYALLYQRKVKPEGEFDADACLEKIKEQDIAYTVQDLFKSRHLESIHLVQNLDLFVNPSGVRIVKLVESIK